MPTNLPKGQELGKEEVLAAHLSSSCVDGLTISIALELLQSIISFCTELLVFVVYLLVVLLNYIKLLHNTGILISQQNDLLLQLVEVQLLSLRNILKGDFLLTSASIG